MGKVVSNDVSDKGEYPEHMKNPYNLTTAINLIQKQALDLNNILFVEIDSGPISAWKDTQRLFYQQKANQNHEILLHIH